MLYARFILSSLALFFGVLILAISFSTANSAMSSEGMNATSTKQFYMGQTILPDHVAYPALMAMDRVRLELDTPHERIFTQIEFAHRRFEYSKALMEKGNLTESLSTLTKSQKYLTHAAQDALKVKASDSVKQYVLKTLSYYQDQLTRLKPGFGDAERPTIDDLIRDNQIISAELAGSLGASSSATQPPQ